MTEDTEDNKNSKERSPVHARQKKKNWAVLAMIFALVAVIFIVTMIRVKYVPQ